MRTRCYTKGLCELELLLVLILRERRREPTDGGVGAYFQEQNLPRIESSDLWIAHTDRELSHFDDLGATQKLQNLAAVEKGSHSPSESSQRSAAWVGTPIAQYATRTAQETNRDGVHDRWSLKVPRAYSGRASSPSAALPLAASELLNRRYRWDR
jgi:hypothetical protein